ncbi:MAG: hypothetical protein V3V84_07670 [Candidatus Bathyarchaeia archaeon]
MNKSWITETTGAAVLTAISAILYQYAQGGIENVSQAAITVLVVAVVYLVQRQLHKRKEAKNGW